MAKVQCPTCEGKGKVRMKWNEEYSQYHSLGYYHTKELRDRYRDEWCRRCDGKGKVKADD